jgi:hypothetical protein
MDSTDRRTELLATLADGVARLTDSEAWRAWLDVQRRFHRYSFGNALLIAMQRPDASQVAGFHAWRRMGRYVQAGEKGIAILAPIVPRFRIADEETGDETIVVGSPRRFRVAHVFDVSQTAGRELPTAPVTKLQGDAPAELYDRLRAVAASLGFTVEEDYLPDEVNGTCSHRDRLITVEVRNDPLMQVKTLAHELAHAILHGETTLPRERRELEAESVAYIVCADLGIDSAAYSFGYLASWSAGGDDAHRAITDSAGRIQKAARVILDTAASETEGVAA